MRVLTEESCRDGLARAGIKVVHPSIHTPGAYCDEVDLSDSVTYERNARIEGHEPAFNAAHGLLSVDGDGARGWILWLHGRVYTDDRFAMSLFRLLGGSTPDSNERLPGGYFLEESERELCHTLV